MRYWVLHPFVYHRIRGPFELDSTALPTPIDVGFQEPSSNRSFVVSRGRVHTLDRFALQLDVASPDGVMLRSWLRCND